MMKRFLMVAVAMLVCICAGAQVDRREVREGNRKFRGGDYRQAEIDYRKAAVKDSLSVAAQYNLAGALYRQDDFEGAKSALESIKDVVPAHEREADYHFNAADVALQQKDYQAAVDAFKAALLLNPGDMDAKESYIYAKKKLEDQQQNGGGGGNDNQDQNQDQNQNQNNDQNQDQNNNQDQQQSQGDQPQQQNQQPREQKISPQQAQQMLNAIQAKEKETQDKVNKEKAAVLKSRQKEKNW